MLRNFRRFASKIFKQPVYALKVSSSRLQAYFFYYFRRDGSSSNPESITIFLTHRCNLRCKMCGQWGEGGVTKNMPSDLVRQELGLAEIKRLVDDISTFKPNITLFGGEPLLYPDCLEVIKYIKAKSMHCLMITNGFLLEAMAEEILNAGLDELNVSLDGGPKLHDQIRGCPGLFVKITGGLKRVSRLRKDKSRKKPLINLQCTITKYNYEHLDQLLDVARDVGADSLTYHNLIFLDEKVMAEQKPFDELLGASSSQWAGFVTAPEIDVDKLNSIMKNILSDKYPFNVDFYPNFSLNGLKQYYLNPEYLPMEYPGRCVSPWIVAYVFPDGEVRPCLNSTYSFGNIKNNKFNLIWNGPSALKFRKALRENKMFPVCARCTELYRY